MRLIRAHDILTVPGLLSLARAPLALAFPFSLGKPTLALTILIASGVSDLLDGWYARRYGQATTTGAILDPLLDKLFVATVALSLLLSGRLSLLSTLLLGARDLIEVPLVIWLLVKRGVPTEHRGVKANVFGKLVTVLQFATIAAALFGSRHMMLVAISTGVTGIVAGLSYWRRALVQIQAKSLHGAERKTAQYGRNVE